MATDGPNFIGFSDKISVLVAMEATAAKNDPEKMSEIIERLINSTAFTIAIAARGNPEDINTILEGAAAYLFECGTDHARVGKFMAAIRPKKKG